MSADKGSKVEWAVTDGDADGANEWSSKTYRAYSGVITFTAPGTYTLAITGSGAPADADYETLRQAKNAFRKYLFDK